VQFERKLSRFDPFFLQESGLQWQQARKVSCTDTVTVMILSHYPPYEKVGLGDQVPVREYEENKQCHDEGGLDEQRRVPSPSLHVG
jgi:hypothetical protein